MPEETIGDRIRKVRTAAGLSQAQFARCVFVSRSTVYKWELDKAVPYAHDIRHISDRFEVSCDYLIKGKM